MGINRCCVVRAHYGRPYLLQSVQSPAIINLDDRNPLDFETSLAPETHLIIHLLKEDLESDILSPPIQSK